MGYERYPQSRPQGDNQRNDDREYYAGRDYAGSASYGSDRGEYGDRDGGRDGGRGGYGQAPRGGDAGRGGYGQQYGQSRDTYEARRDSGTSGGYRGSYGAGGHRFEDVGNQRHADDDNYNDPDARYGSRDRERTRPEQGGGRQPRGDNHQERGFVARAGDEVRSWFGDDDAERRREQDARADERQSGGRADRHRDEDYHSWRSQQIAALDRDYDEYRQENRSKFHSEFGSWRTERQGQRDQLNQVQEHAEVLGSDGQHVGTVDKVRGDRILLTKTDKDAGGQHHSIPSRWLQSVSGDKVTISKTADEAKKHWRDEEGNQALFGDNQRGAQSLGDNRDHAGRKASDDPGAHTLNKGFSGTY